MGRRSQSWGRKPVLLIAFTLATSAMLCFALVAYLGLAGMLGGLALFGLIVLLRGLGFGSAMAAVPPTAVAYIANVTPDEESRVKGMSGVGAAQGIAMVLGSVAGGALSTFGLMTTLIAVPVILGVGLLLLAFRLRPEPQTELIQDPQHVSPFDARIWPFLVAGFGMFTSLGFVQIITGFLIQDRFDLTSNYGLATGGALLAAGLGMVVAQAVVVPRTGWHPVKLLRVGATIAAVGFALLIPEFPMAALIGSIGLVGFGLGIAVPGYTAGPTLEVSPEEQGGMGGLISATNGLTFVIAPTAGTALYGINPTLPIAIACGAMVLVTCFVFFNPQLARSRRHSPTG